MSFFRLSGLTGLLEPDDSPRHPLAFTFGDVRRERRLYYATKPRRRPRSRAIVTIVHNESLFLPIWLRYYRRFFAAEDMYVLDNDTTDGSTAGGGFQRIPAAHETVDVSWMRDRVQALQHELLERYELVVVTDVDELIAPVPRFGTLGDYLDRFDEDWVNCLGYELVHMRDSEPPLDLSRPILSQRHHWFFNPGYDKAAIATVPMEWKVGFHGRTDNQLRADPDLRMIHLHRMDYDLCLARHQERSQRRWARLDDVNRWSVHNQIVDEEEFARWFYTQSGFEFFPITIEEMPPGWHDVF